MTNLAEQLKIHFFLPIRSECISNSYIVCCLAHFLINFSNEKVKISVKEIRSCVNEIQMILSPKNIMRLIGIIRNLRGERFILIFSFFFV